MITKKRLLIFHPALAPYRIDQFNLLNKIFDLHIVFLMKNLQDQPFNQSLLLNQLHCNFSFLLRGIAFKKRIFRFGIYKKIKYFKPDIIIGYEYSLTTQYLIFLKKIRLIKQLIATSVDDNIDMCNKAQTAARHVARQYTLSKVDYLIVLSKEVAINYNSTFEYPLSNIIISPILQDPDRLKKSIKEIVTQSLENNQKYSLANKKVLLYVGRLAPEKGLIKFISNILFFLSNNENIKMILVGDGPERESIKKLIREHDLENKILLPGRFEGTQLYSWYLCASGLILPSLFEPYGAVVNEALIFGLKVFCSSYAGACVLLNTYNGRIFNPLDETETLVLLKKFMDGVSVVKEDDLYSRKSLINYNENQLISEWGKLI